MAEVTKEQYEYALERIEELLPYVGNDVPMNDKHMIEMDIVSDIVNRYEKIHYPIAKPTLGELIADSLDTMGLSAKGTCEATRHQCPTYQCLYSRQIRADSKGGSRFM